MIGDLTRIGQLFFPTLNLIYLAIMETWDKPLSFNWLAFFGLATLLINAWSYRQDYHAGTIEVERFPDGGKRYTLNLESDPDGLDNKKKVTFYVEETRD